MRRLQGRAWATRRPQGGRIAGGRVRGRLRDMQRRAACWELRPASKLLSVNGCWMLLKGIGGAGLLH